MEREQKFFFFIYFVENTSQLNISSFITHFSFDKVVSGFLENKLLKKLKVLFISSAFYLCY